VTCTEIHEQITAYVDDRVDEEEYRQKVQQHITYCPDCRAAYELELKTKMVVHQRAQRVAMPLALRQAIEHGVQAASRERADQIRGDVRAGDRAGWFDRFGGFFTSPIGVVVAMLLVIVGAYVIFAPVEQGGGVGGPPQDPHVVLEQRRSANPENFFNKAASNFAAILEGNLTVQHATSDRQELARYFQEKGVAYTIAFPRVHAELVGGVVSEHGPARYAHLVYAVGDTLIYMFEVPKDELRDGKVVYVTQDVMEQLEQGKAFWEEPYGTMRLVMFEQGDVICAVVSNAPRSSLEHLVVVG